MRLTHWFLLLLFNIPLFAQGDNIPSFKWTGGVDPPVIVCSSTVNNGVAYISSAGKFYYCSNASGVYHWDLFPGTVGPQGPAGTNGTNGTVIPTGLISFIATGTCPTGWTELTTMVGLYILGTKADNGDVGTTGGSTSYTPTGSSAANTVNSLTAAAQAFTGTPFSSVINHTHTATTTWNVQGSTTASTSGVHVMTSTSTGGSARAPTSGDVVSVTTANPAGGVSSITPAGTNGNSAVTGTMTAGAFTGTPATIQPPFIKLIPCSKN